MGYGRQVAFGENPNRWNFKSDRDFRTLASTVYQSEVWACTPTNWYLKKKGCLTVECDEMWSFVGLKHNKQWIWLALDSDSREIVGMHGCMLGAAIMPMPRHYGNHCHQSTVNAPFVTLIFGLHMSRFFPKTDIEQLVKKTEKRTALKGSTLH